MGGLDLQVLFFIITNENFPLTYLSLQVLTLAFTFVNYYIYFKTRVNVSSSVQKVGHSFLFPKRTFLLCAFMHYLMGDIFIYHHHTERESIDNTNNYCIFSRTHFTM